MDFQFNSSNAITGDDDVRARIETSLRRRLERIAGDLTRVELHLSDLDGTTRHGPASKRARLEGRPRGRDPIVVTHEADTVDAAAAGAADKLMRAFERDVGKRTNRKGH
ncbi:MAG: HPF/RaiA family ribosome-associated protein [Sphingomonadaceae bacterium]